MKSTRIMNRRLSASKYLQRNISLAIEFWCWHCIGTPSNRLMTMSFYSRSFPPEIKKTKLHLVQCPKIIWRQHPLEILIKRMEKDCHSSCGKCYIWGFHANNVSKPKPHIWCQTALKLWSCRSFKIPFSICFFAFLYAGANSFGSLGQCSIQQYWSFSYTYLIHWLTHPMAQHFTWIYEERKIYLLIEIKMHYLQ
jgi:hypothetical protein